MEFFCPYSMILCIVGVGQVVLQVAAATPCKLCYGIERWLMVLCIVGVGQVVLQVAAATPCKLCYREMVNDTLYCRSWSGGVAGCCSHTV